VHDASSRHLANAADHNALQATVFAKEEIHVVVRPPGTDPEGWGWDASSAACIVAAVIL
jgi:hypothetical protein